MKLSVSFRRPDGVPTGVGINFVRVPEFGGDLRRSLWVELWACGKLLVIDFEIDRNKEDK